MRASSGGSRFSPCSTASSTKSRAAPSGKIDLPSRLPDLATDHDRSGSNSLSPVDDGGIFFHPGPESSHSFLTEHRCWLGWGGAHPENVDLSGLSSHLRIVNIFVRTSHVRRLTFVSLLGHSALVILPPSPPWIANGPRNNFSWRHQYYRISFAEPFEDRTGSAEAPAAKTAVLQHATSPTRVSRLNSAAITVMAAYTLSLPHEPVPPTASLPIDRVFTRTRRRTDGTTGTAPPSTVDNGVLPGRILRLSALRANTERQIPRPQPRSAVVTATVPASSPAPTVPLPSRRPRRACSISSFFTYTPPWNPGHHNDRHRCPRCCSCITVQGFRRSLFARWLGAGATGRACLPHRHALQRSWPTAGSTSRPLVVFIYLPAGYTPPMTALSCSFVS